MTPQPAARVLLAALLVLSAGCSTLPTSGPVRAGRDLEADRVDVGVRVIGQPPLPGATPQDIVLGFLQAGADFVNDHAVARLYLAPKARQEWRPNTGTAVYDRGGGPFTVEPTDDGRIVLTAAQVAAIDGEGHYARTPAGSRLTRAFGMTRVDGEWRISSLDNGLVLTRSDVQETYRRLDLHFLSPSRRVLVPETVFLPAVPGLSTALVTRLLSGPTDSLAAAATTAFPRGTSLAVSSVPVRDGIALVNLDGSALQADATARVLMSAQLVWTLKQLPDFQGMRITVEGEDFAVPGQGQVQALDAWTGYDPGGLPRGAVAYAVRSGRLARIVDGRLTAVSGPAGDGRLVIRKPAVSLDGSRAAGLLDRGRSLVTGRFSEDAMRERLRGGALSAPSWDVSGDVWVVDASVGRVWVVPDGTRKPQEVAVPALPAGRVTSVRVARDGARVALVVGAGDDARLYVGTVGRRRSGGPAVELAGLREVLPELRSVRDVAWADADRLALLGSVAGGPVEAVLVGSDGYELEPVEPRDDLVTLAAAPPRRPLIAGTAAGRLAQYTPARGWVDLGPGSDPSYPG